MALVIIPKNVRKAEELKEEILKSLGKEIEEIRGPFNPEEIKKILAKTGEKLSPPSIELTREEQKEETSRSYGLSNAQLAILYRLTHPGDQYLTADALAKEFDWSAAHVRKILTDLRRYGLTDCISAGAARAFKLIREEYDPREKLHYAAVTWDEIIRMYPEAKEWEKKWEKLRELLKG
jgi:hypothetical protein